MSDVSRPWYVMMNGHTVCEDCGVIVMIREAHTRFHSILSSHAWPWPGAGCRLAGSTGVAMDKDERQKAVSDAVILERAIKVLEYRRPYAEGSYAVRANSAAEGYLRFRAGVLRKDAGAGD